MSRNIPEFEKEIGIEFADKKLLEQAFIHRSFLNENRGTGLAHNERLEFLGDAVLELVATEYLYGRFPEKNEGELTSLRSALVNTVNLASVGADLHISDFLLLSRGEAKDTGRARDNILANTMESIIGAMYLDRGYECARDFVHDHIFKRTDEIVALGKWIDAKSLFQEKAQEIDGVTPIYKTIRENGPDHDKHFTVGVFLGKDKIAEGAGKSKQDAEQDAARKGLEARYQD